MPAEVFSAVRSAGQEVFHDTGVQRPAVELRGHLSSPTLTEIPEGSSPHGPEMPSRISGGHELLSDVAPAPARPEMDVTSNILQSFARSVRKKIEASKKYPIAAQTAGIEGRTGVRMTILKDGRLQKVEVAKSSGYEILDKAALQSVREAAPFPPIPEKARREEIQMSVTLIFKIT
jgi:protein TonB